MDFQYYYPCFHKGNILCKDCDEQCCDMRESRKLKQKIYEDGYNYGLKNREPPNIHCFYYGGMGCMNLRLDSTMEKLRK